MDILSWRPAQCSVKAPTTRNFAPCASKGHVFITNDKKDFNSTLAAETDHTRKLIYTDPRLLRDHSEKTVQLIEYVFEFYSPAELEAERVWLD